MKKLLLSFTLLFAIGCASLAPGGAYNGNKALYQADATIVASYKVLHTFLVWETANRANVDPSITAAADDIRKNQEVWFQLAIAARDVYEAVPTPANKAVLDNAINTLTSAQAKATIK